MKRFIKYIKFDIKDYGYFDSTEQTKPKVYPQSKKCLICGKENDWKLQNISVMADDLRCWFFYIHEFCYDNLRNKDRDALSNRLVDHLEMRHKKPLKRDNLDRIISSKEAKLK